MITITKTDDNTFFQDIKDNVKEFVRNRNWEQFHDCKNLSMAISIESAELMEHFLWIKNSESLEVLKDKKTIVEEEVADIAILLLEFCNTANIDLSTAIVKKIDLNNKKYPIELSKNCAKKYTDLGGKNDRSQQ